MADSTTEKTKTVESSELISTPSTALIFISHDNRDAELAEAFSKLLSSVSCGVLKSFRSSDRKGSQGIEFGVEWYPELMSKLNVASDVVCLLTQRSLDRPWILYEAGVAKGKLNTPVYGIALGISLSKANSGPFAQFQNCDDNEESLTKLVMQLVKRIPNSEPDHDAIELQVKTFKQKALKIPQNLDGAKDKKDEKTTVDDTSVAKLFEEVKLMFQDLPSRVEGRIVDTMDPLRRRKSRRFHPMMFEDMLHFSSKMEEPLGILIAISLFRDELPWLYEIGLDFYRTIKSGNPNEIEKASILFHRAIDFVSNGPMGEMFMDSKESFMMLRELQRMLERYSQNYIPISKKNIIKK